MKQILLFGAALLAVASAAVAAPLTPDEALARVSGSSSPMKVIGKNGKAPKLVMTTDTEQGSPAVYIFNRPDDNGYMLVSADDMAYPLLGYADDGSFDIGNIPPAMQWWLDEYSRQIAYASANAPVTSSAASAALDMSRAGRQAIEPMIQSQWDQTAPYNDQCPLSGVVRTYTGCVATAMAQVMYYWKYPAKGQNSITYTAETLQKKLTMNFASKQFDWDNMLEAYYPGRYDQKEADAVAYLMKACGYAVKMDYGTDSSGALAMNIRQGLVKYFNYDANAVYDMRMFHSATEWETLVYDNLKNVGPVIYGGASTIGGGHSFICDGYDGNGYFHFNWGWTGMSNGYFSLDALNPDSLGSGGGGGGGYNFTQDAVFGVQPPTGKPVTPQVNAITEMGSLVAEVRNDSITFDLDMQNGGMWVNYNPTTMKFKVGAGFRPENGGETVWCDASTIRWQLQAGYGFGPASLSRIYLPDLGLADGTYKVSLATMSLSETDADWVQMKNPYGYFDYVVLTKKGSSYSVENKLAPSLDVIDGGFDGTLYYGCVSRVWAELKNPYDIEISTGLAPILANETGVTFLGESVLVTVPAKSTKKVQWTTPLYAMRQIAAPSQASNYVMSFMDENTMLVYSGDIAKQVTLYPNPGAPSLTVSQAPVVKGAKREFIRGNGGISFRYTVDEAVNMEISSKIILNSGYFAYPVMVCLAQMSEEQEGMVEILTTAGSTMFIDKDVVTNFNATLSYPSLQPGKDYMLVMAYEYGSSIAAITGGNTVYLALSQSGVEDVAVDTETTADVYNLQGVCLRSGVPTDNALDGLPAGIYIVNGRKIAKTN